MVNKTRKIKKSQKVVVGLSGGIDSAVALLLFKNQGWQPTGLYLKTARWKEENQKQSLKTAEKICRKLKLPFFCLETKKLFKSKVVDYFLSEFNNCQTPNPCIICNRFFKFKSLLDFARKKKIDLIATGHYSRVKKNPQNKKIELLKAKDKAKDQSYNLCFLNQEVLNHLLLPLGNYSKKQVRQIAEKQGLFPLIKEKESQDFCYLAGQSLKTFLKQKIKKKKGKIIDGQGNLLGYHQGLHFYTIGQRKNIHLPDGPYYVKEKNLKKNLLIVSKNKNQIVKKTIYLQPYNFISGQAPKRKIKVKAQVRYRQALSQATLSPPVNKKVKLVFNQAKKAVARGQFAVFYQQEVCLGGGKIT